MNENDKIVIVDYLSLIADGKPHSSEKTDSLDYLRLLRDYYDNNDTSSEMEDGEWEYPYPEQLELGLEITPARFDENTVCTDAKINIAFDYELSDVDWIALMELASSMLDEHFPGAYLSGSIRRGTDRELFPEDYNASKVSESTEEEEM